MLGKLMGVEWACKGLLEWACKGLTKWLCKELIGIMVSLRLYITWAKKMEAEWLCNWQIQRANWDISSYIMFHGYTMECL